LIDERCIGPEFDRSRIDPSAEVTGASYLTGANTRVGAGAVVRDSRLHEVVVEAGAEVIDSIIVAEGEPGSHKCDAAGRVVVTGAGAPRVGPGARIAGSTLVNTEVGERTSVRNTWAQDVRFGPDNDISDAKIIITNTASRVTVSGPTEVSEAWLGDGTTIDERGYYEGVFSNAFRILEFDESSGALRVAKTIQLPHVSRYGVNTVNSTNSGKLKSQPDGVMSSFGPKRGLWKFSLLSHEQIELGPCCFVAPWTKVIGQSAKPHETDDELVNDELMTYLSPFSVAGVGGSATNAMVMPGELSTGFGPKQRKGAWTFTYAPGLVIGMVRRLHDALEPERKGLADTIVTEALKSAIAMTRAMAARNSVDLTLGHSEQKRGWPRWIGTTHALLRAHLESGLWQFEGGEPVGWTEEDGRWTNPKMEAVLSIAPDALDEQTGEEDIFAFDDPVPPVSVALPAGGLGGTGGDPVISPDAHVHPDAVIGPGCRIGPGAYIETGVYVWNSVVEGCYVERGSRIERSQITKGEIGEGCRVRSSVLEDSSLDHGSTIDCADMADSSLAGPATVTCFASLKDVTADYATIIGGAFKSVDIDVYLMSMHMCGGCFNMKALPREVEVGARKVQVPAIPMLGGGSLIRGTEEEPVMLECSFIGSNAILEPGSFVGFGCFVLGTLGPGEGLLPFTVSTGGGPGRQQIGSVITAMASTAITHFVEWTYQAVDPASFDGRGGLAVASMMRAAAAEGAKAIRWEQGRRMEGGDFFSGDNPYLRYGNLPAYTDAQLENGLSNYRHALEEGAWDLTSVNGELVFTSRQGRWEERGGSAFWKAAR